MSGCGLFHDTRGDELQEICDASSRFTFQKGLERLQRLDSEMYSAVLADARLYDNNIDTMENAIAELLFQDVIGWPYIELSSLFFEAASDYSCLELYREGQFMAKLTRKEELNREEQRRKEFEEKRAFGSRVLSSVLQSFQLKHGRAPRWTIGYPMKSDADWIELQMIIKQKTPEEIKSLAVVLQASNSIKAWLECGGKN